jgi:hypothetical protein
MKGKGGGLAFVDRALSWQRQREVERQRR